MIAADNYFTQQKEKIATTKVIVLLDGMTTQMWNYKDDTLSRIEAAKAIAYLELTSILGAIVPSAVIDTVSAKI